MRTILFLTAFIICAYTTKAQKRTASEYETEQKSLVSRLYQALIVADQWRPFEREIDKLIEDMDSDLSAGSGLSFDDMNKVRAFKSSLKTIKEFGDGVAAGGYNQAFNGRTLKRIRELFPSITFELFKQTPCVSFYRVIVIDYTIIVARHNEKGVMREVSWWDNAKRCKTLGGSFTLYPGVYKQFWNNSACLSYNGSGIVIKSCEFKMSWDSTYDPVKGFVEE